MKKLLTLAAAMLTVSALWAVPAKRGVQTIEQPDGTTINVELHGDEHFHFTTTDDGYLVQQNADGVYEYAEYTAEKVIKPLGIKAHSEQNRTSADIKNLSRAVKAKNAFKGNEHQAAKMRRKNAEPIAKAGSVNLAPRGLALLVQFSDKSLKSASTQATFSDMLNGDNYTYNNATGSAKKYFSDQSNGQYVPQFDVIGPITLSNSMSYYGGNDSYGNDLRPGHMVNEACSIANADFNVDFTKYDGDGDGYVDIVYVIYAGYGEASGAPANTIWPHAWDLYSAGISTSSRRYDGKIVENYACSSELSGRTGSTRDGIGTFCHEFSHVLGLPDYYDIDYGTNYENNATPGLWSLMDQGSYNNDGKTPPNYSAYDKYYLGWTTPTIMNKAENVTIQSADNHDYRVVTADGNLPQATYTNWAWYFENRQLTGWDAYLPGHGLLVTKVKYSASVWAANGPNDNTMYYDIVEADGKSTSGDGGDTYPGTSNKTSYTPTGSYDLTEITESNGVISFKFMGGVVCEGQHTVYFDGENCTETNGKTCIDNGETYTSTITPATGYELTTNDILVTIDGNDAEFTYENNVLTIPNITGDVEIIAIATKSETTDPDTPSSNGDYVKVTAEPSDWSGEYVIVYEDKSEIFDGSLTTLDATSNYQSVSITNNTIPAAQGESYRFTIAKSGTAYTIQSASGYYIGNTSNSNKLLSSQSTAYTNTISLNTDGSANVIGSGGSYLRYNATSGQDRFRYYKSSSYSSQKPIALYKKTTISTAIETPQNDDLKVFGITNGIRLQNIPNDSEIKIFNIAGQIVYQNDAKNSQLINLPQGIYIVKIINNKINKTLKVIVK